MPRWWVLSVLLAGSGAVAAAKLFILSNDAYTNALINEYPWAYASGLATSGILFPICAMFYLAKCVRRRMGERPKTSDYEGLSLT
jgi:hypothetical protein